MATNSLPVPTTNAPTTQRPSPGRIVFFHVASGAPVDESGALVGALLFETHVAVILEVISETCVTLRILSPVSPAFDRNVSADFATAPQAHRWTWPPRV